MCMTVIIFSSSSHLEPIPEPVEPLQMHSPPHTGGAFCGQLLLLRELRTRRGRVLGPLPTHSLLSAESWKPGSHRQWKEPSVLTQCPLGHGSVLAHSSTSRTGMAVRGSHGPQEGCGVASDRKSLETRGWARGRGLGTGQHREYGKDPLPRERPSSSFPTH